MEKSYRNALLKKPPKIKCTYKNEFKLNYLVIRNNNPSKYHELSHKKLSAKNGWLFFELLIRRFPKDIKTLQVISIVLLAFERLIVRPNAEDPTHFCHRARIVQACSPPEPLSLLASFHSAGRCCVHYWRRKVIINLTHCEHWATTSRAARHAHSATLAKCHRSNHYYLIGFGVHLTEMSSFLVSLSENPWLQVIGSTEEPNASIQLTEHSIKPATNYLLLYLQISLLFSSYHRFYQ